MKSENVLIFALPNDKGYTRLAINVSSKVGNAVFRNRIKRICREIFRKNKKKFPESYDIIIIPLENVALLPREALMNELFINVMKLKRESKG